MELNKIIQGDALEILKTLPNESIDCIITSPPYWALRDYGITGQLGLEPTIEEYIDKLCNIFDEAKRVLKKEGTLWVNIGDTYSTTRYGNDAGTSGRRNRTETPLLKKKITLSEKSLCQIPARFSIEMASRGWILRNEIIWHKPNCMPQSVTDRFTVDFEKIFFFVQNKKYYFEQQTEPAICIDDRRLNQGRVHYENGKRKGINGTGQENFVSILENRNKRTVWKIPTKGFEDAHFATFPEDLLTPMIKAGSPRGGVILDPFMGAGTTAVVANNLDRNYLGIEINPEYIKIAEDRLKPLKSRLF